MRAFFQPFENPYAYSYGCLSGCPHCCFHACLYGYPEGSSQSFQRFSSYGCGCGCPYGYLERYDLSVCSNVCPQSFPYGSL